MLIDALETGTSTASRTSSVRPVRPRTSPRAFSAPRSCSQASSGASSFATGTRRSSRPRSRRTASCRRSIPTRSPTRSSPRTSARCRDHHAAMISQHMRHTAAAVVPTGDFLAHVGDWTGLPAVRAARPDARRPRRSPAGASAELERLIAAIGARSPRAGAARVGRTIPAACSRRCARSTATPARPCPAISTSSATACSTASTSASPRALELPDVLLRVDPHRRRSDGAPRSSDVERADRGRPRAGARGAPGAVRRAARRGAPDLPAPRRARRLQRHLGLRADAASRARGRASRSQRAAASTSPST